MIYLIIYVIYILGFVIVWFLDKHESTNNEWWDIKKRFIFSVFSWITIICYTAFTLKEFINVLRNQK